MEEIKNALDPIEFFNTIKSNVKETSSDEINNLFSIANKLLTKYKITGQKEAQKKISSFDVLLRKRI